MATKRATAIILICLAVASVLAGFASAAVTPGNYGLSGWNAANWSGIAVVAVMTVVLAAAMVYMLASIIGSGSAKEWSKRQIYEALLSFFMLIAFLAFVYVFFLNPQNAFSGMNLVPTACSSSPGSTANSAPVPTNLFSLAACDLGTFNKNAYTLYFGVMDVNFLISSSPFYVLTYYPLTTVDENVSVATQFGGVSSSVTNAFSFVMEAGGVALLATELQMIVLAGSIFFLFVFITLGLIARTFGFARSFGGTLIALGLGLGLMLPLLVAITYGYIDVQIQNSGFSCSTTNSNIVAGVQNPFNIATCFASSISSVFINGFSSGSSSSTTTTNPASGVAPPNGFLEFIAAIVTGLSFVPILNLIIVDAFIVDLSRAIGEQVDLFTLMTGFV